jgi:hypothetical protein
VGNVQLFMGGDSIGNASNMGCWSRLLAAGEHHVTNFRIFSVKCSDSLCPGNIHDFILAKE